MRYRLVDATVHSLLHTVGADHEHVVDRDAVLLDDLEVAVFVRRVGGALVDDLRDEVNRQEMYRPVVWRVGVC